MIISLLSSSKWKNSNGSGIIYHECYDRPVTTTYGRKSNYATVHSFSTINLGHYIPVNKVLTTVGSCILLVPNRNTRDWDKLQETAENSHNPWRTILFSWIGLSRSVQSHTSKVTFYDNHLFNISVISHSRKLD